MNTNKHKPHQRLLAMALSFAMLLGLLPMPAFAESGASTIASGGEIIAFESLVEAVANQAVPLGTSLEKLNLPKTLTSTVRIATATDATVTSQVYDKSEQPAETPKTTEMTIPVPVTWVSEPKYDGDAVGAYIFTAQVPDYTLNAELPKIIVTVGEAVPKLAALLASSVSNSDYEFDAATGTLTIKTNAATDYVNWAYTPTNWRNDTSFATTDVRTVIILDGVTSIGTRAFYNCGSLTSVTIPSGVNSINPSTFSRCEALHSVNIPNTVTNIDTQAFWYCKALTSVTIPANVTNIGMEAFCLCQSMTDVTFSGSTPPTMANSIFDGLTSGLQIIVPQGAKSSYETALASALPNGSTIEGTIDIAVIGGVTAPVRDAASVSTITETEQYIGTVTWSPNDSIFKANTAYTAIITLAPKTGVTLTGVAENFFTVSGATRVSNEADSGVITAVFSKTAAGSVDNENYEFDTDTGTLTIKTDSGTTEWRNDANFSLSDIITVNILNSVTSIGDNALESCASLTSVTIPNCVTSIGKRAFLSCTSLTSVTLPNSVTSIGDYSFWRCTALTIVLTSFSPPTFGAEWADQLPGVYYPAKWGVPSTITNLNDSSNHAKGIIDIAAIGGVTAPIRGATPVSEITETEQYTGTITWNPIDNPFKANTTYTATITLTPKEGFTFTHVAENFFSVSETTIVSNNADSGVITAVFPKTGPAPISIEAIGGVTAPVRGATPVSEITETEQYTGTITWEPADSPFGNEKAYTATITLMPKAGYTLTGVTKNFFTVSGATSVNNEADSGVITAVFPKTEPVPISIAAIGGVTAPVRGANPVSTITETAQYTGTVTWNPVDTTFKAHKTYTATITLISKTGYTTTGVPENFFTVSGATSVSNEADSGVITVVFPMTDTIPLTITDIEVNNKIYDGTITATLGGTPSLNGIESGDTVSLTGTPSATFADANAGSGKLVTITGFSLTGADAHKYRLNPFSLTGTITPKPLTAEMITLPDAPLTYTGGTHTPGVTVKDGSTALALNTDYENVAYSNNTNAGTASVSVNGKVSKDFTITKAALTIASGTVASKTYDGTTTANITALTLSGLAPGEALTLNNDYTVDAQFDSADAGSDKTVTGMMTLANTAKANNYSLESGSLSLTGQTITKADAPTVPNIPKIVLHNDTAYQAVNIPGFVAQYKRTGDTLTYTVGTVSGANPGIISNKSMDIAGVLTFTVSGSVGNTATIPITVSGFGNYHDITVNVAVTLTDKTLVTITATMNGGEYKGSAYSHTGVIVKRNDTQADVTGAVTLATLYESADGGGYSSAAAPANVGAYKLTLLIPSANATYAGSAVFSFTITKKTVLAKAEDKTAKIGNALPAPTVSYSGFVGADSAANALTTQAVAQHTAADTQTAGTFPITFATDAVLNTTIGANYTLDHQIGNLIVTNLETYTITASAGANGIISPSGAVVVTEGDSKTFTITANAGYSISSVTVDDVNQGAVGAYTFSNVTGNHAISATFTGNSGIDGSGGGGGGGSITPTPPSTDITTDKQPDMPTTAKTNVYGTAKDGVLSATITEQMVKDAIRVAQDVAKKSGKEVYGIALDFNVTGSGNYTNLNATIDAGAIDRLKEAGVKFIKIGSTVLDVTLDTGAIVEIDKQTTGTVTVSATKLTKLSNAAKKLIGNRPVFDITVSYQKSGKTEYLTNFGKGAVTLGIVYTPHTGGKTDSSYGIGDTPYQEQSGYLYAVYVDKNGKPQLLTNSSYNNGRVIFSRNSLSTYGVGYKAPAQVFTDTAKHWAKDNIDFVASRDLISGKTATTFAPNTAITRADFLMALGRLSGANVSIYKTSSFTDVKATDPAMPHIEWAVGSKIVSGYGNGKFGPDDLITRDQMAVMMQNYAKATGYILPTSIAAVTFSDSAKISAYAKDAVKAIQQAGIMQGKGINTFDPQGNATRGEASTILRRFVELVIDEGTARGWSQNDVGQWKYIGENGKPVTGWLTDGNAKYYFTSDGIMVSGKWLEIDGKWYYFYADGTLAKNTKIDEYEVDANGVRKTK